MNAETAKRLDDSIVAIFDAEELSEFDRIGFLEILKVRLEQVWIKRYYEGVR